MAGQALICRCGDPLATGVTRDGLVTLEGLAVRFRRRTDYVLCPACLSFYRARDLRDGRLSPLTLMEIKFLNELEAAEAGSGQAV